MDKKLAGLLGSGGGFHNDVRGPGGAWRASRNFRKLAAIARPSRSDLNALPLLKTDDQRLAQSDRTRTAQVVMGHHHHHHHRRY